MATLYSVSRKLTISSNVAMADDAGDEEEKGLLLLGACVIAWAEGTGLSCWGWGMMCCRARTDFALARRRGPALRPTVNARLRGIIVLQISNRENESRGSVEERGGRGGGEREEWRGNGREREGAEREREKGR